MIFKAKLGWFFLQNKKKLIAIRNDHECYIYIFVSTNIDMESFIIFV